MTTAAEVVDRGDPDVVGEHLLSHLRRSVPGVDRFAESPHRAKGGMEAYVYFFLLEGKELPARWRSPLVVRLPRDPDDHEAVGREERVMRFPVPRPILSVSDHPSLGPFCVMERVDAFPVFDRGGAFVRLARTLDRIARFHRELHQVDPTGWPLPADGSLVDRRLRALEEIVATSELGTHGVRAVPALFRDGFRVLADRRWIVAEEDPRVLHTDFVGNVLTAQGGGLVAVDWGQAEVGDLHDDVARSTNAFASFPLLVPLPGVRHALFRLFDRMSRLYVACYRRYRRLDPRRLRYWSALQTLEWALAMALSRDRILTEHGGPWGRAAARGVDRMSRRLLARSWGLIHVDDAYVASRTVWAAPQ